MSDDRSRDRVGRYLREYGERVQYSVYEIAVPDRQALTELYENLKTHLEEGDRLTLYRLCADCRAKSLTPSGEAVGCFPGIIVV
ncbi:CRISPR-associated endonuclease Cas2 [Hahella sp. CCB-MM4]|nr:CRISPR-associated endonuclease Cas2 [Hahella sp. CCB-MM4]